MKDCIIFHAIGVMIGKDTCDRKCLCDVELRAHSEKQQRNRNGNSNNERRKDRQT